MTPAPLDTLLSRIVEIQIPLPAPVALLVGILVFAVIRPDTLEDHEHAETVVPRGYVGLVTGHRIRSVTINRDGR